MFLNQSYSLWRNSCLVIIWPMLLVSGHGISASAQDPNRGLPHATPESVGMRTERLSKIEVVVRQGIEDGRMPGCVVAVGRRGRLVYHRAFGCRRLEPERETMTVDTVFDLASLTKPIATATSVMVLVDQGKVRLDDKVSDLIDEFSIHGKGSISIADLLTHRAGFVPDNALADYKQGRKQAFKNIYQLKKMYEPRTRFVYSDVGFILLDDLIERVGGLDVHEFSQKHVFQPLGMQETGFLPKEELRKRAATSQIRDGRWMRGEVHDPRAHEMGGVAGHAGLFSTASDLSIYAQMMLQGGEFRGQRILSTDTMKRMTSAVRIVEGSKVSIRGYGWDKQSGYSSNRGTGMSPRAFGHGGFTGTVIWVDPELDLFFIFLSNRVHPDGKGSINRLAGQLATIAVEAIVPDQEFDERK